MHPLIQSLAHSINLSRYAARQLNLDAFENLLAMASAELATRTDLIERREQSLPGDRNLAAGGKAR